MNQACKSNFKTHVEKLNPTSRTDLSNKTLRSILYWKLLFKPFPYKSFGWCNAHSVQADALWGRSFKFQMKNTPQNQYFPANAERMDVHCLESGCIGKYIPLGPRDFPRAWILHPSALEISLGLRPREISRASGCKIPALGKSLGPRGMYFPIHPSSRQCTDTILCCIASIWKQCSFIPRASLVFSLVFMTALYKRNQNDLYWLENQVDKRIQG